MPANRLGIQQVLRGSWHRSTRPVSDGCSPAWAEHKDFRCYGDKCLHYGADYYYLLDSHKEHKSKYNGTYVDLA